MHQSIKLDFIPNNNNHILSNIRDSFFGSSIKLTYEPILIGTYFMTYAISIDPDQHAHPHKLHIMKTHLFKYIENFTTKKRKFSDKNSNIFYISSQNIDCGTR